MIQIILKYKNGIILINMFLGYYYNSIDNNLINKYVRKFDDMTGRFTSIDPFWNKYYGLTPYHYSGNNPISKYDANGKWVKEVSAQWHIGLSKLSNYFYNYSIPRNDQGFLAQKLNFEFYEEFQITAPKISKYLESNDIYVLQYQKNPGYAADAETNGDIMRFDLSQSKNLKSEVIHEVTHLMGSTEFQAYCAQYASGYLTREMLENALTWFVGDNFFSKYFRQGIPPEIRNKFFDGSGSLRMDENLRNEFFEYILFEGEKWIK